MDFWGRGSSQPNGFSCSLRGSTRKLVKPPPAESRGLLGHVPSGISRVAPLSGALAADTSACGYTSPASRTLDLPVHLLVIYPPKVRRSELVNSLKGVSSRRLR